MYLNSSARAAMAPSSPESSSNSRGTRLIRRWSAGGTPRIQPNAVAGTGMANAATRSTGRGPAMMSSISPLTSASSSPRMPWIFLTRKPWPSMRRIAVCSGGSIRPTGVTPPVSTTVLACSLSHGYPGWVLSTLIRGSVKIERISS
ncbi:hypothetical protein [Kutzneria chonburiensis]|uniref:hypothetical protein n=1 Tax=Kutzneria chonburiensis TaxID=1483604 RepID=UPI00235E93C1|nr:hypothetical protein [Kutzneria chonburiensis]